jgi:hypothetical protein
VRHIAACSQNALDFHRDLYGYQPAEEVAVFLEDWSDFGHGGANTVPVNFVTYGVAPFNYVYETVPAIDRMFWMANHEMAHIATMDQAAGRDLRWRALFGGKVAPIAGAPESIFYNYLTNPRWNAPRWYHEGIAVFLESWMAGGLGRVLGGYDEMVFRSMVRDDALFYDVVGLESEGTTVDFQVGVNSYLYGTRFMSYLAYRHGPEKVIEWTARRPGSRAYFAAQFERVFDAPLAVEWSRWIEFERDWQRSNLAAIQEQPTTPVLPLSEARFGSVSRPHLDRQRGAVYLAVRYPGQLAHLARLDLDSGRLEKLANVEGAALFYVTSLAFDPERRLLYFTTDNYGWRDLHVFDLERGSSRRLQKDLRAGDLVWDRSRDALWGVRHVHGISTLVRIDAPTTSGTRSSPGLTARTSTTSTCPRTGAGSPARSPAPTGRSSWCASTCRPSARRPPRARRWRCCSTSATPRPPTSPSPRTAGSSTAPPTTRGSRTSTAGTSRPRT